MDQMVTLLNTVNEDTYIAWICSWQWNMWQQFNWNNSQELCNWYIVLNIFFLGVGVGGDLPAEDIWAKTFGRLSAKV